MLTLLFFPQMSSGLLIETFVCFYFRVSKSAGFYYFHDQENLLISIYPLHWVIDPWSSMFDITWKEHFERFHFSLPGVALKHTAGHARRPWRWSYHIGLLAHGERDNTRDQPISAINWSCRRCIRDYVVDRGGQCTIPVETEVPSVLREPPIFVQTETSSVHREQAPLDCVPHGIV